MEKTMKRLLLAATFSLTCATTLEAIPAQGRWTTVRQPDGTTVTIRLVGDEWSHCYRTLDGYTVVQDAQGYYTYAQLDAEGRLAATGQAAHDSDKRGEQEQIFAGSIERHLTPQLSVEVQQARKAAVEGRQQAASQMRSQMDRLRHSRKTARRKGEAVEPTVYRGLIVLVEFNDRPFLYERYDSLLNEMVNQENYTGYTDRFGHFQPYVGSVRDYFADNSNGMFIPQFDVVGPVKVNYSQTSPNSHVSNLNAKSIFRQALLQVDDLVDFRKYDEDNDGTVDRLYFIVSGYSANVQGNNADYLWPHEASLYPFGPKLDGVKTARYACSTELTGSEQNDLIQGPWAVTLDGIGTICHEFSHVLGAQDHYDANYATQGESFHPGEWDVMATGTFGDKSRQPVGYSLYERVSMGFCEPLTPTESADFKLHLLDSINNGLRIPSGQPREVFYLENRQQSAKWGRCLPGHGLLVWHIDSTDVSHTFAKNEVNTNAEHNCVRLVRANPSAQMQNGQGDPFPGTGRVRDLSNATEPANLLSWTGKDCGFELEDIREVADTVTFLLNNLRGPRPAQRLNLPAQRILGQGASQRLVPDVKPHNHTSTLLWESGDETLATVDATGRVTPLATGECPIYVTTDSGLRDSCNIQIVVEDVCPDVSAFLALEQDSCARLLLKDAVVQFCHGDNVYLRDATGALVLSGAQFAAEPGTQLSGSLFGRRGEQGGMPLLVPVPEHTDTSTYTPTTGLPLVPVKVALDSLNERHLGMLVNLWGYRVKVMRFGSSPLRNSLYKELADSVTTLYLPMANYFMLPDSVLQMPELADTCYYSATGILRPFTFKNEEGVSMQLGYTAAVQDVTEAYRQETDLSVSAIGTRRTLRRQVYALEGVRRQHERKGLNIVRLEDGRVVKYIKH